MAEGWAGGEPAWAWRCFLRERACLTLTPAGQAYLRDVRPALVALERATANVMALKGQGDVLNVSVGASLGNHWLLRIFKGWLMAQVVQYAALQAVR